MANFAYFNYTVPDGRVAILRGFRYELAPLFGSVVPADISGALLVGSPVVDDGGGNIVARGIEVPQFSGFQLGQAMDDYQACYVLAAPGQTISILLTFSVAYQALAVTSFHCIFYGNLLLQTGRQLEFEPGNIPREFRALPEPAGLTQPPVLPAPAMQQPGRKFAIGGGRARLEPRPRGRAPGGRIMRASAPAPGRKLRPPRGFR